jgi:hypothetical protein
MNAENEAERAKNLIHEAVAAFGRMTGLQATVRPYEALAAPDRIADAIIEIRRNDHVMEFFAEAKLAVDRGVVLGTVKRQLMPFGDRGLLIAPYLTAELAAKCRHQLDLQFMDAVGNAYIRGKDIYVFTQGQRPQHKPTDRAITKGAGTPTALRMIYALLCRPALLNAPYRAIAAAAGIALGAVGWVFFDLEARGFVAGGQRRGGRRLLQPMRLFEEWVTSYGIKLRPKLFAQRFQAPEQGWWKDALHSGAEAYWGGEVAADLLTGHLNPAHYTLYVRAEHRRQLVNAMVKRYHLRADPRGNLEIIDAFWNFTADAEHPNVVNPMLVYADLLATFDPRNLEIATMIHAKYLDYTKRPI